ncbi:MAG: sulfurtransferase TusA family protein [Thermoplasmata archaeon]|nr:sulfurtransferase TusA family protein [Thermoplasmata archaeon]
MAEVKISTVGLNCPKPLIETRKAMRKLEAGDILIIEGDHAVSKDEIQQAVKDTGDIVLGVEETGGKWVIKVQKSG